MESFGRKPNDGGEYEPIQIYSVCSELDRESQWALYCKQAIADNVICDLPSKVLFILGLESAVNLAFDRQFFKRELSDETLEDVIERTWRAIQK